MLGRQLIRKLPFLVGSPSSPVDENIENTRSLFALTSFLLLVRKVCVCVRARAKSCRTLQTQWTVASQAPLSMGLSWQEYWTGLPSPSPGDLPDPGTERVSSVAPALAGRFFTTELPGKAVWKICVTSVKYVTSVRSARAFYFTLLGCICVLSGFTFH